MNVNRAKQIPIDTFLARHGITPQYRRGHCLWYHSPLRREKTPSFKVNRHKNTWYDFGHGRGGTLIDLIMAMFSCDVSTSLKRLAHIGHFDQSFQPPARRHGQPFQIRNIKQITHPALLDYLEKRAIPFSYVSPYLTELHYQRAGRNYFALAFTNRKGGYELRNKYFKGVLGPKDLTLITGSPHELLLFEGFMDFLSYLTLMGIPRASETVLVLNSTALASMAVNHIKQGAYRHLSFFFDNDPSGLMAMTRIAHASALPYIDRSVSYGAFKDLNDFARSIPESSKSGWGKRNTWSDHTM
ncbi:MAG: mobilization protein [Gammaproteobacteria bacterium]|nr:mobilization protein [Gammaproteobacteria bacterium]